MQAAVRGSLQTCTVLNVSVAARDRRKLVQVLLRGAARAQDHPGQQRNRLGTIGKRMMSQLGAEWNFDQCGRLSLTILDI
jgi:hypothetical protein